MHQLKLTIVAATGRIGSHLVDQALAAGHEVTAVVRNPAKLTRDIRAIATDLTNPDPAALEEAVKGADAVLSGLGPRSRADSGITAPGTRAIVDAMLATQVKRIVVVSAAPVATVPTASRPHPPKHDPGEGFVMRHLLTPMIKSILRVHYEDLAAMEELLRESGLQWTAVRPPRLTDAPLSTDYRTAIGRNIRGGALASRADVAHCMLRALTQPETVGQTIGIAKA
jgi:putative NADH-flavin reductase